MASKMASGLAHDLSRSTVTHDRAAVGDDDYYLEENSGKMEEPVRIMFAVCSCARFSLVLVFVWVLYSG